MAVIDEPAQPAFQGDRYFKLGLIGHPVSHSISPLLHGAALSYAKLRGEYNLIDIDPAELADAVPRLFAEGYCGLNVTVPHKRAVFAMVDELTEEARKVQAVNTVSIVSGGKLIGHNTDLGGFVCAARNFFPSSIIESAAPALVLGAGGAARAAVWGLIELGVKSIVIIARNVAQAEVLKEEVFSFAPSLRDRIEITAVAADCSASLISPVIVNCTPVGLKSGESLPQWCQQLLSNCASSGNAFLYDMVYVRGGTTILLEFFRQFANTSCADGRPMLVHQALLAFQCWTGIEVPAPIMEQSIFSMHDSSISPLQ